MTNHDQAFFAAYRPSDASRNSTGERQRPPSKQTGPRGSSSVQPHGKSVDAEYCDVTWYRLDARHDSSEIPSKPHRQPEANSPPPHAVESHSTAIGIGNVTTQWQASCLIITPSFAVEDPRHGESTDDTRDDSTESASPAPHLPAPHSVPEQVEDSDSDSEHEHETRDTVRSAWKAAWEVDEFAWPADAERLFESQRDYFRFAGEKLCDASREGLRVLAVTATREKEGCTTMAICLARAAAAAGAKVALLDGNLSHPELGFKLGLEFSRGWQESLGGAPLSEAAVMSLDNGLTLFPLSAAHHLATLNDPAVSRILEEAARTFDLIITDAGALPSGEAHCFEPGDACPVHAALIIRDMRRTSETETLVTASRLKTLGLVAIGIAENFLPEGPVQSAAA